MSALSGKMSTLVLFVLLLLGVAFLLTPLVLAPLGVFTGMARGLHQVTVNGFDFFGIRPWFPFVPLWSVSFVFFIVWIAVVIWVYKDAERRGMSGLLWALLVFIGNLIGLLIYLIVRQDHPSREEQGTAGVGPPATVSSSESKEMVCAACGKPVERHFVFCPHCGASLQPVCKSCGKAVDSAWKVCPHCGASLKTE
ncbi:MAG: zinc ribbon domain-containing protein [Candidatus Aminicenantes bacterium]|nr:zinc ribbon domain-containing protein [Candidatus Aminicenantes bacterium]